MELNQRAMKLWNKHNSVTDQMLPRAGKLRWKNTLQYCITRPQAQHNSRGANTRAQLRIASASRRQRQSNHTFTTALKKIQGNNWTKADDTQFGFCPGCSTTEQISLSSKFLRNLGSMPNTFTHVLSTSRKHTTGSSWKALGSVAALRCWRPPVAGRQVIVFLLSSLCPRRES